MFTTETRQCSRKAFYARLRENPGFCGGGPYTMRFRTMRGVRYCVVAVRAYAEYLGILDDADVIDLTYAGQ